MGIPSLRNRRLSARPGLSAVEQAALECVENMASEGVVATQAAISAVIGSSAEVTATSVVNRLVAKGYLERVGGKPLQKALWLMVVDTGQSTAEPHDKTPHWRFRAENVQIPAIQSIRERSRPLSVMIEVKARQLGKPLQDFLMDCVYAGYHTICGEE